MRVRRVYIKKAGGELATEACYTAWRGFLSKGYPLDFFEHDDLTQHRLRLDRLTLVVGGTVTVHTALRQIGVPVPPPLNIPTSLSEFAGRRVWEATLGDVRRSLRAAPASAVFLKPLVATKSFAGGVFTAEELHRVQHLDDDLRVQAAEPVSFASEWRHFVRRGRVVGLAHYKGDWAVAPDAEVVRQAVARHSPAPAAYSLDFGVTTAGRTLLVEANDAFALGAYGLDATAYADMLEDRWMELVAEPAV